MNKFSYKLAQFMYGRYLNDSLNTFMLVTVLIIQVINFFLRNSIVLAIEWILLIIVVWRMFSKQIYQRRKENETFLKLVKPFTRYIKLIKARSTDKNNKYYLCPNCKQMVRVPKGRGKIKITCPKCTTKFIKKT